MESNKIPDKKKGQLNSYIQYSSFAFQMIATLCLAAWLGFKLDHHFKTVNPWFTIGLMLLAVVGSLYLLIKSLTSNR
ncbi:MAG TPA: AtpZ/AtpI family protein [Cytophagaceae bacterium]